MHLLLLWLVTAVGLMLAAYLLPGIEVDGFGSSLKAALVIGILDVTLGWLLSLVVFPLTWLLPNLIYLLITSLMILIAGRLLSGFVVKNYLNAFLAALVLMIVRILLI